MFAVGMQILPYLPHVFASVGQKHNLLVFLHPLRLYQLPESPAWLPIVSLDEAEAFGRRNCTLFAAPKRHDTPPGDHLETAFFVGRSSSGFTGSAGRSWPNSASIRSATAWRCSRTIS